ncbi:traB domain-containing protein [Asbolus verrucosus]|uniref:TraB domain-containing protein n=1 Tax=Asbolus verrucosus TaxID=1661398 RepID=A0A482VZR3_ASBVE|nr:traB domain-containing protein [Asbolus verrucosus]
MDNSLTNFELTESTIKASSDSEHGSDKSETMEILSLGETDQSSSNGGKSDEDFDNNLPETVTLLKHEATGAKVYLVGTAHFSNESKEDVIKVIQNILPHVVVLELCSSRTNILSLDEKTILDEAKNIDLSKIITNIRSSGLYNGIMYILLLNMSAHITKELGMAPGGEFRAAYREAEKVPNCEVLLGDRPLGITLQRALSKLTWFQTVKLAWHLLTSKEKVSIEDIEKCKKRDMLEQLLTELAGEYPAFRDVFLNERDIFLTHSLQTAAVKAKRQRSKEVDATGDASEPVRIVGVVGIGHVPGITKLWPKDQKALIGEILKVPPPSLTSKVVRLTFRISLLTFGGYLVYRFVPVPKMLKENAHVVVHKMLSSVKGNTDFKYVLH